MSQNIIFLARTAYLWEKTELKYCRVNADVKHRSVIVYGIYTTAFGVNNFVLVK